MNVGCFWCVAVNIMSASSSSSFGAMAMMFGTQRRYAMSNNPWCVGPSCGESPARSMQKITGKSCNATS